MSERVWSGVRGFRLMAVGQGGEQQLGIGAEFPVSGLVLFVPLDDPRDGHGYPQIGMGLHSIQVPGHYRDYAEVRYDDGQVYQLTYPPEPPEEGLAP